MATPYLDCPDNWKRITLEANRTEGFINKVSSGGTPSTSNEDYWEGDIPWLTPKEVAKQDGSLFVSSTERYITSLAIQKSGAKLLPPNTVMLTKRAPVGSVAINTIPMATNQGFLNFQCGPKLRPQFLAYWLIANRPYLYAVANGSTYPELYTSDLFEFEMSVPDLDIQDRILSLLGAVKLLSLIGKPLEHSMSNPEEVLQIQERNSRLTRLHDNIMPLLMSGQLYF